MPGEAPPAYVRPSSLQIADKCSRAPWLAHHYPEEDNATRKGNSVDAEVSICLSGGAEPTSPEGIAIMEWVRKTFPADAQFLIQRRVTLYDPTTGEVITEGTPDLLVLFKVGERLRLVVVDWKKKGQLFAGHLAMPDVNLQQLTYMVAGGMEFRADESQIILACFERKTVSPIESRLYTADDWWAVVERVKAVPRVNFEGPQPLAVKGDHCGSCWQKLHCSAYLLPAIQDAPAELVPFMEGGGALTEEKALQALAWIERAEEVVACGKKAVALVEDQLKTFVAQHGPIRDEEGGREWGAIPTTGNRRGPTLEELEDMGLPNLIKPGKPGTKYDWRKVAR